MEKNNKMKISAKTIMTIFIIALVSVFCIFGLSKAFAEPTIYDLVEEPERIGNFEPNRLVQDDDEMYVSAWLNVNNLMFSYDYWYDYDENGVIDAEDVYQQEDFENNMRMNETLLPIFRTGNSDDNFYFVPFSYLQDYNDIVVMNVELANNNDLAELKDATTYWYDKENKIFYFQQSLIQKDIEEKQDFNTVRCETTLLVKSVPQVTKNIGVFTIFDDDLKGHKDKKQLDNVVPNGDYEFNLKEWDSLALQFQFVPENYLAYISKENLDVYLNYHILSQDAWAYDDLTGIITINADTTRTTDVVVKVKALNDVSATQQFLQTIQAKSETDIAQAASSVSMKDVLKDQNAYLHKLTYTDSPPEIGTTQKFDYMVQMDIYGGYNVGSNGGPPRFHSSVVHDLNGVNCDTPVEKIETTTMDLLKKSFAAHGYLKTSTISAFNTESLQIAKEYGSVVESLMLANKHINNKEENRTKIQEAVKKAEELLFTAYDEVSDKDTSQRIDFAMKMTNKWMWNSRDDGSRYAYVYGTDLNRDFLGGTIGPNDGYPFFDVVCAQISASNWTAGVLGDGSVIQGWDSNFNTKVTILDVEEDKTGNGGFLYLGLWATTLDAPTNTSTHTQRVLAFSKVRYEYNGTGSVRFLKKDATTGANLSGAKYGIYTNAACDTKSKVAEVVSRHDAVSVELKHGTYYVKEITPPSGYTLDTTIHKITVSSGKTVELVVKDQKQTCTFTLTTIDKTTQGSGYEMPVPGITYELYDRANPTKKIATYTSDSKGKITGTVNATGEYFLKQTGTVTDYRMETNSKDADYCNRITIDARPNTSGKNFQINKKHYEKRQTVIINTPVWDENLKEHSPAELGGDEGGNVSLVNATYKLKAETPLFLGYHKGQKVTVPAGTMLTIDTYNDENSMNTGVSNKAYSKQQKNTKAMLGTAALWVTSNGTNLSFHIPNGKYQWIMDGASPGYVKTDSKTTIDASWTKENSQLATLECNKTPVIQKRQTCAIDLYVKTYVEEDRVPPANGITNQPNLIKDKVYTRILNNENAKLDNSEKPSWQKHIDMNFKKDVRSNANSFGKDTVESATLYENGKQVMAVKSSGVLAKNAVYSLRNLCNIVDVKTGKEIPHGTILGYFQTDENGKIHIETLGSDAFENPNKEFNKKTFENIVPLNANNIGVKGNPLPNGLYGLVLESWPSKSENPKGLMEDFVKDLQWDKNKMSKQLLSANAVTFIESTIRKPGTEPKIPVAPDMPPDDKTPPYDPNYPESPDNPDDSNDIPRVDIEWIDNNFGNLAYRIIDSENISGDKDNPVFEVNDKLPTTFAFYVQDNTLRDEIYHTRYYLSFYYEISAQEYEAARAEAEGQNALDEFESKLEYIKVDGKYARRFNTPNLSGGDSLTDVIAFNKLSDGWVNINEAAKNKTVSGAIYNTDWINEKLAQQADGDYNIYIYVDPVTTYESKTDGSLMEIKHASRQSGTFVIKNRQLVNLD